MMTTTTQTDEIYVRITGCFVIEANININIDLFLKLWYNYDANT